jgi:hypothetical protein
MTGGTGSEPNFQCGARPTAPYKFIHLFGVFSQEKEGDLIDSRKMNRAVEPLTEMAGIRIDKHEGR